MIKELASRIKEIDVGNRARNHIIFILWLKVHDLSYLTVRGFQRNFIFYPERDLGG
jgi:hypothetical protein